MYLKHIRRERNSLVIIVTSYHHKTSDTNKLLYTRTGITRSRDPVVVCIMLAPGDPAGGGPEFAPGLHKLEDLNMLATSS